MAAHKIAVIPGDGIGQEVMPEGLKVLRVMQDVTPGLELAFETFPWGCDYYDEHGHMMPHDALKTLEAFDAIYFGAVGDPDRIPDHISLSTLILPIRKNFQQFACIRPIKLLPGVDGPLAGKTSADIDFVMVRENTEGEYADAGGRLHPGDAAGGQPFKRRYSPAPAASGSCGLPSTWRAGATRRAASRRLPNPTRSATAWCSGTTSSGKSRPTIPT